MFTLDSSPRKTELVTSTLCLWGIPTIPVLNVGGVVYSFAFIFRLGQIEPSRKSVRLPQKEIVFSYLE